MKKRYSTLSPEFFRAQNAIRGRIANMLIELRQQRKLSQQSLAKMVKTTQAVISRIENMNANPSLDLLERIAHACGKNLEVFFS
jgi:transcriptional regulator with XRE-family HTH domain